MTFLIGLMLLCLLVVFHELGHFLAAKSFGIRVERFSVGFGKPLVEFKHGETVYAFAAVPLGGFVKMAGENPEDESTGSDDEFSAKPWWQRFVVVTAGPIANLICALIFNSLIGVVGIDVPMQPTRVDTAGEVASEAGFMADDRILSIAGTEVDTWYAARVFLSEREADPLATEPVETEPVADRAATDPVEVAVERSGATHTLRVAGDQLLTVIGDLVPWASTEVGDVSVGMPAYQAGLREGDVVVAVAGTPVKSWNEMREAISSRPGEEVAIDIEREGQPLEVAVRTMAQEAADGETYGLIGIGPAVVSQRETTSLGQSVRDGVQLTINMTRAVYGGFWTMVTKPRSFKDNVAGPITIAQLAGSSTRPSQILYFLAFISLALMALNLLPIPILDGGHAMFCLIEGIRGKALSLKAQLALQRVGLVVIGSLVIMAVFNDVKRVVERTQAVHRLQSQETTETR